MQILSLGKLGNRLLRILLVTAMMFILLVITSAMIIRSLLDENIQGQRALDQIEEASDHLYRSLIDQETGQRGYVLTKDEDFLEPYEHGIQEFESSKQELSLNIIYFPSLGKEVESFIEKGEDWQQQYGSMIISLVKNGKQPSTQQLQTGKDLLDDFRTIFSNFNEDIEAERTIVRTKMKNGINLTLIYLVLIMVVIILINLLLNVRLLKSIIKPIIHLNSCVKRYTQHDFLKQTPHYQRTDELSELIRNVDIMRNELSNNISLLEAKANMDALTGVYNRHSLKERIQNIWSFAKERKCNFSFFIIDIDCYKNFNDTYGHLAGDECLKKVANCINSFTNEPDSFVARYGGEEFCIAMIHNKQDEASITAEEIRMAIERLQIKHETSLVHGFLTVSIGVVTLVPEKDLRINEVLTMADKALYEAKQNGRNHVMQYNGNREINNLVLNKT
ncbi:MAG TPA: diguanylate cyclase [Ureibacillus sp.]|nr:diguanylate cyclase [Ureibacillus sp.]